MAPSYAYLTVPGHPTGEGSGLCLGPGLRGAGSSRNPNSTGRAPHSHPIEAPFWRRRARLNLRLPGLGTSRDDGADAELRSLPTAWLPGLQARTTGGRHGPQECRAQRLAPAPRHRDGARRTGVPRTGLQGPPGSPARRTEPEGATRSPGRPPALATQAAPELRASRAAPGLRPPAPAWASSDSREETYPPGTRRPEPRDRVEGKERRGEGVAAFAGALRLSRNPPKTPSIRRRRPASRGHSGRPGRSGPARGGLGDPQTPAVCSYLGEKSGALGVGLASALCPFQPAPRLPCSSQPLGLGSPGSAARRPRPRPRLPPRPPTPATPPSGSAPNPSGWRGRQQIWKSGARRSRLHVESLTTPPRTQPNVR